MDAMTQVKPQIIRPQDGPQEAFLKSAADICVYGGSAGGGKTWGLIVEPLRHVNNPGFGAVIFRRVCPQITCEGGLWDESMGLYPLLRAKPIVGTMDWRFPSGANIGFSHMQHETDKLAWQGSQIPYLGFDELTHFHESQFFYMLSRNRSVCGVRPYIRATCNPEPGWVKRFLGPWVDRLHPLFPTASGVIRWFIRVKGEICWVDADTPHAKSVTFIRASVYDNKILLDKDPGYLSNLLALPPVEQARLLNGDWDVRREGLVYPDFDSCIVEPRELPEGTPLGGIDWGWNNPAAFLAAVLDHDDVLWIHWERCRRLSTLTEHSKAIPRDGIVWYADPAGADQINEMRQGGHLIRSAVHQGTKPLEAGIGMVAERIRKGTLKVFNTCKTLVEESGLYHYDKDTEKPVDADNHACFIAGTMIATSAGLKPIESITPGTLVATRAGWKAVEAAGMTGRDVPVCRVEFSDGRDLIGTPNHPVFTRNRGWVRLDSLQHCDTISCIEYSSAVNGKPQCQALCARRPSKSSSMAFPSVATRIRHGGNSAITTRLRADNDSIGQSGNITTGQSQTDTTSTIETATVSTMTSPIWSALRRTITSLVTWMKRGGTKQGNTPTRRYGPDTRIGLQPTKEANGSSSTPEDSERWCGRIGSQSPGNASNAERITNRSRSATTIDSAQTTANQPIDGQARLTTKTGRADGAEKCSGPVGTRSNKDVPVHAVLVSDSGQRRVYNLQVAEQPEYFANGVLVHNCAALRYLIVSRDRRRSVDDRPGEPEPAPIEPRRNAFGHAEREYHPAPRDDDEWEDQWR